VQTDKNLHQGPFCEPIKRSTTPDRQGFAADHTGWAYSAPPRFLDSGEVSIPSPRRTPPSWPFEPSSSMLRTLPCPCTWRLCNQTLTHLNTTYGVQHFRHFTNVTQSHIPELKSALQQTYDDLPQTMINRATNDLTPTSECMRFSRCGLFQHMNILKFIEKYFDGTPFAVS